MRWPAHINWRERVVLIFDPTQAGLGSTPQTKTCLRGPRGWGTRKGAMGRPRPLKPSRNSGMRAETPKKENQLLMAKIAKTGDRKKVMDTTKSTDCPKCSKPTRIVKRVKDRERGVPGGVYISCSVCEFYEKL